MITLARWPTLIAVVLGGLALVYLSLFGTPVHTRNPDIARIWHKVTHGSHHAPTHPQEDHHGVDHFHHSGSTPTTTSVFHLTSHTRDEITASATPSKPPGYQSSLAIDSGQSACPVEKPNLVLSAINGPVLQEQIFPFLQSLDLALGQEILANQRAKKCPPAPVHVHFLVPQDFLGEITPAFRALMERYPALEFVPAIPDIPGAGIVLLRFKAWADYLRPIQDHYGKVLTIDTDVIYQRNPFAMPLNPGVEVVYFAEWRGLKIGQCGVHKRWFDGCVASGAIEANVSESYKTLDRICAGSTYGTSRAMQVYLDTMTESLAASGWGCNDQAMHIHLYYSGQLQEALEVKGYGSVYSAPNSEALLGTVGTTPMVRFNEWGEMLNEQGHVQHVIHQFKLHTRLREIVAWRYGWMGPVGVKDSIPPVPVLVDELTQSPEEQEEEDVAESPASIANVDEDDHAHHHHNTVETPAEEKETEERPVEELKRYLLSNIAEGTCEKYENLCSCRFENCQLNYGWF